MELSDIKNSENKTEIYLKTPHTILQHLQTLHIFMTSWMKELTSKVEIIKCRYTFYHNIFPDNKPSAIIQNKSASNPYSKYMFISTVSVYGDDQ